jgi:transglutaminase-like putative cysteine protease
MARFKNRLIPLVFIVFCSLSWGNTQINKTPTPDWVSRTAIPEATQSALDNAQNGTHYLLIDAQIKATEEQDTHYHYHFADFIINQTGVEKSSQINISYDPSYQSLSLHTLAIIRQGQRINKLDSATMQVIQREEELDNLIYNGDNTLNIILDDVRVGDTIEYSFSRIGDNPVFQGIFSFSHYTSWSVPVEQLSIRLLWQKQKPLFHHHYLSNLKIQETKVDSGQEFALQKSNIQPVSIEDQTPIWFDPWSALFFSELETWGDVVNWSLPLYSQAIKSDEHISKLADNIRKENPSKDEQIAAALQFTQDKVRYLGIEIGQNSHVPTPPAETLKNRYGDCKDKTVLLLTLLKELGITAYPALVNTEVKLDKLLPSINAFDHVLVYAEINNKSYWLDPTRSFQHGQLDTLYQPDYSYALVLKNGSTTLTAMNAENKQQKVEVHDLIDLSTIGKETFTTKTHNYGLSAERQRQELNRNGREKLQQRYLTFFQHYYPSISVLSPIEYSDDKKSNILTSTEHYQLNDPWQDVTDKNRQEIDFYANIISTNLPSTDEISRAHPLHVKFPNNIEQTINIKLDDSGWSFDNESFQKDNPYFTFNHETSFDHSNNQLTLSYRYSSKTGHIPAEAYDKYKSLLKDIKSQLNFGIYKNHQSVAAWYSQYATFTNLLMAYGAIIMLVILLWRLECRKIPADEKSIFFPVSPAKHVTLWVLTFGIYGVYWFYKNFRYIKEQNNLSIMPLARGFFYAFWYYPLWEKLKEDNNERFEENHLPKKSVALFIAILFFIGSAISSRDSMILPSLIIGACLTLPLVNYILYINGKDSQAFIRNSAWRFRHYLLILITSPLLVLSVGSEYGLMPSDSVVKGKQLLSHDIKFMQRNGILKPEDKLEYFYSDAFLFVADDGNGFTERHVFSYWKDENGSFTTAQATYDEIENIEVHWGTGFGENTTLTITKTDGNEFLLFVANTDRKDQLFVETLKLRWKNTSDSSG